MKITVILLIFILGSSISYGSSALDDMIKKYSKNIPQDKFEEKNSFKGVVAKSKRSPSSKGVGKEVAHLKKYTLQVASFKSKPEAVDYVKSLVKESRNYFVTVGEVGGLLVYRVNTGVFMTSWGQNVSRWQFR